MKTTIGIALGLALLSSTALASGALSNTGHSRGATGTEFQITNLVSDQDGMAGTTDADLVNAWGIAQGGPAGPIWVSDNGSGKATVYDHSGAKDSVTVAIANGGSTGVTFVKPDPNGDTIFPVTENDVTASSLFVFATTKGQIEGWNQSVDPANAIVAIDNSATGAVYTGVSVSNKDQRLFAANFRRNKVEIYDKTFALMNRFTDRELPALFGPFNVMVDRGDVFVAFAQHEKGSGEEVKGAGLGYIDVFRRNGRLKTRLVTNGVLNAPWGMAIAPPTFGQFAGALLVGNFGDGKINAFDRNTGQFLGTLSGSDGSPLVIDGLWGIQARPLGKITFASGPDDEAHGLVGSISPITQTVKN